MAKSAIKTKQNPQLKQRPLSGGRIALYLEYYQGRDQKPRLDEAGKPMYYTTGAMAGRPMYIVSHHRKKEELKLYLIEKPRTPEEREKNKETLLLAERIRQEKEQERLSDATGYRIGKKKDELISFFESFVNGYAKKDQRNLKSTLQRFKTFLREDRPACATRKTPREIEAIEEAWKDSHKGIHGKHEINENEYFRYVLKPGQLTPELARRFVDYLKEHSTGEGASTSFERFKRLCKEAVAEGLLKNNPCNGITCPRSQGITKDVLSPDEIKKLLATHYQGENPEIRRAFILTLFSGIRYVDIKELKFSDVNYTTSTLSFDQSKTKGHSSASRVVIPLRADLLRVIGKPEDFGRSVNDRIFLLPSHTMCLKALKHWTSRAGIEKHITWHCGRHSFATNVIEGGASVVVAANLLGHSGLRYVERYAHALEEAKLAAVESLPNIEQ